MTGQKSIELLASKLEPLDKFFDNFKGPLPAEYLVIKNITDLEKEILHLQKTLFDSRMNESAKNDKKFHTLKDIKHQIAQLKFKRSIFIKSIKLD